MLMLVRLTFRFIQLFDLQRVIAENSVGADIYSPTARVDDQNLVA